MHTIIYKINSKDLLCTTGKSIQYLVIIYKEKKKNIGIDTHVYMYNQIILLYT